MNNIFLYIMTVIIFLAPYKYMNQDNINGILILLVAIYGLVTLKKFKGNKIYLISISILGIVSILSLFITGLTIDSLQGVSLYISLISLYLIFSYFKDGEEKLLKVSTYVIAIGSIFYIVLQGAISKGGILEGRIDGNIGYANSYALVMIIALYFNRIREKDSLKEILDIVFVLALLFTGSRNSLLYLAIFVVIDIVIYKREHKKWNFIFIFNIMISTAMYLLIEKIGLAIALVLPILIIVYYYTVNDKYMKIINIVTIIAIPVSIIVVIFTNSNLVNRLSAMSINSPEFQLRIGYFEDVIQYINKNPFGGGINTYMYNQGSFQTGFYDVRYVHNAFGQALYDMGWLGLISFILVFIAGLIAILKGSHKRKFYYIALYLTIYCHSILDFNFAYMFTIATLALIVGFVGKENVNIEINIKPFFIPVTVISLYISILSIMNFSAQMLFANRYYKGTISIGKIMEHVTIGDNIGSEFQFKGYVGLYAEDNNTENLKKGIAAIEEHVGSKNRQIYICGDLATAYGELNDVDKASYYYEKNIELQKYNLKVYESYCNMLRKVGEDTGTNYEDKCNKIMKKYNDIQERRSELSKKRFY